MMPQQLAFPFFIGEPEPVCRARHDIESGSLGLARRRPYQLAASENCGAIATYVANFCRVTFDDPSNGKQ